MIFCLEPFNLNSFLDNVHYTVKSFKSVWSIQSSKSPTVQSACCLWFMSKSHCYETGLVWSGASSTFLQGANLCLFPLSGSLTFAPWRSWKIQTPTERKQLGNSKNKIQYWIEKLNAVVCRVLYDQKILVSISSTLKAISRHKYSLQTFG